MTKGAIDDRPFPLLSREVAMKQPEINQLCLSCRRTCKQQATAVIAACPRYYPGPKIKRCTWTQLELSL